MIKMQCAELCCLNVSVIDDAKMDDCQIGTLQFNLDMLYTILLFLVWLSSNLGKLIEPIS